MSKINFLTIAVVLLLLLNAGTLAVMYHWHAGGPGGPPDGGEGPAAYIVQTLKLDAQQQEQFAQLRREHRQAIRSVHEEDKRLHDAYFSLLKTDHPDKVQVDSLANLLAAEEKLLSKTTFEHFEKLRALCRPDQKELFDATIDEIAHRMAPPPQRGPREGPPR
jgi:protein CpxP